MADTIQFGTKAETLSRVAERLKSAVVLPQVTTTVEEWTRSPTDVLERTLTNQWDTIPLIVRSSTLIEDGVEQSMAGKFDSYLNILGKAQLEEAVAKVIQSFEAVRSIQTVDSFGLNQVLIQPMLQKVALSGVAFSCEPNTGAPYYVINFDNTSGATDSVTAGTTNELHTYIYHKSGSVPAEPRMAPVIALLQELEQICSDNWLDVEFAIDEAGTTYLLQVRPLVGVQCSKQPDLTEEALTAIAKKFDTINSGHPTLLGARTVLAVMPDWNPAEIIGVRPNPLALSLYKEVITDSIWAYQRDNYGYKNLRSHPLLVDFHGLPYVDVRVSFNSFLPKPLNDHLSEKLVNFYIDRLVEAPEKHDKVEFDIILSCYTFDLRQRTEMLREFGFTTEEIDELQESLRWLTNNIIHHDRGLWLADVAKIKLLDERRPEILSGFTDPVSRIYWLLEDCKRYGTLPFAGLARAGFIAVQLLRSLVTREILSTAEFDRFLASVETVSSKMTQDFAGLSKAAFLEEYGHLRPGTYDILSLRYDEDPDCYFDWAGPQPTTNEEAAEFSLTLKQLRSLEKLLKEEQLELQPLELFEFIKAAIEGREFAKFAFTKNLSLALSLFADLGAELGFSREDCSYANIKTIAMLYSSSESAGEVIARSIETGRAKNAVTKQLTLPAVITDSKQIWSFERLKCQPNFVTQGQARGPVIVLDQPRNDLEDAIVCIPNADPGYDWIFSKGVAALITAYGGANSHMAIRAAELKIPAVIGVGETLYEQWSTAKKLEIDCGSRVVRIIAK